MQLSCSICGERYSAAHEAGGTEHYCPGCLQLIAIQGPDTPVAVPSQTDGTIAKSDSSLPVAVALGVVIGHLVIWMTLGRPSSTSVLCSIVGGMTIVLGLQGFSPQMTGIASRVMGSFVLLAGLLLLIFPRLLGAFIGR